MGRNYITERSWSDPRERAIARRRKREAAKKRQAAQVMADAAYAERAKWCRAKGCQNLAKGGDGGWWPCCSKECFERWHASLK